MVITKALALWLFIVGVVWALVIAWIDLVMTGFTDRIVPLPVFLVSIFFRSSHPDYWIGSRDGSVAQPIRDVLDSGRLRLAYVASPPRLHRTT